MDAHMPRPGDLSPGFFVAPGRCFRMVYSDQLREEARAPFVALESPPRAYCDVLADQGNFPMHDTASAAGLDCP